MRNKQCQQERSAQKVVPLVFEHFGLWGEEAYGYLKELTKGSRDSEGWKNVADILTRWRR